MELSKSQVKLRTHEVVNFSLLELIKRGSPNIHLCFRPAQSLISKDMIEQNCIPQAYTKETTIDHYISTLFLF